MIRAFASFLLVVAVAGGELTASAQTIATPADKQDGLTTATLESVGLTAKPLLDMESAIRAGEFKKIGSVVAGPSRQASLRRLFRRRRVHSARHAIRDQEHHRHSGGHRNWREEA